MVVVVLVVLCNQLHIYWCSFFDVNKQGIHLDFIFTLPKFYPLSAKVLKQHSQKDSIYFERKKAREFCCEIYIFGFSIYQV